MEQYKKKVDTELGIYFPGWFGDDLEFLENLRQFYVLRVEVLDSENDKDLIALQNVYDYFLRRNTPLCFNPYDDKSVLIHGEKEFEEICNSMEDSGIEGVKECTVFEFYSKVQFLEKKIKKMKSHVG